jgi:hypothetical protein
LIDDMVREDARRGGALSLRTSHIFLTFLRTAGTAPPRCPWRCARRAPRARAATR